jgi:sterol desaturase/sphingolipid hydroxylase (fatty acid hydroxylase superfamily)
MLRDVFFATAEYGAYLAGAAVICTLIEAVLPGEKHGWASTLRGLWIWLFYLTFGVGAGILGYYLVASLGIPPLFRLDLSQSIHSREWYVWLPGYVVFPFITYFIYDFFYYWFHRLEHSYAHLWRVHAVHHSIEEMNAVNSYHHILEDVCKIPLVAVPMALLFPVSVPQIFVVTALMRFWGIFIHMNSPVSLGPMRYVLCDPYYHRIHHSVEPRHRNRNFAVFFPFWDVVFGTAYFPKKGEFPKTGLVRQPEPQTVGEYLLAPVHPPRRLNQAPSKELGSSVSAAPGKAG